MLRSACSRVYFPFYLGCAVPRAPTRTLPGYKPRDTLANRLTYACMRLGDPELMHKALDLLLLGANVVVSRPRQITITEYVLCDHGLWNDGGDESM